MSHRTRSTQHATHGEVQRRSFIVRERFPHQLANRKTADRSDTSDTTSTLPITIFDFDKEIIEYCKNDVFLLAEGCLKFRQEFLPSTDLDCFKVSTTIPSASIKNFKSFLLREKTIAHIPELGYFARQGCQRKEKTNRLSRRVSATIPSACMKYFKSFLLREKTIAHIPELGYFARQSCQRKTKNE
ncbi:hypothetical protein QR680_011892 [Steinernema hermaphroditum]|uniref:DNA-directed DNA polymerase n=1 Tax=Steinernema hermaphroditum TaxID=289476 RepID=A0AA39I2L5_9BILA|nr:hypothetical protein QR680_011892 [Steinernema hermaphroditum]